MSHQHDNANYVSPTSSCNVKTHLWTEQGTEMLCIWTFELHMPLRSFKEMRYKFYQADFAEQVMQPV